MLAAAGTMEFTKEAPGAVLPFSGHGNYGD